LYCICHFVHRVYSFRLCTVLILYLVLYVKLKRTRAWNQTLWLMCSLILGESGGCYCFVLEFSVWGHFMYAAWHANLWIKALWSEYSSMFMLNCMQRLTNLTHYWNLFCFLGTQHEPVVYPQSSISIRLVYWNCFKSLPKWTKLSYCILSSAMSECYIKSTVHCICMEI